MGQKKKDFCLLHHPSAVVSCTYSVYMWLAIASLQSGVKDAVISPLQTVHPSLKNQAVWEDLVL